MAGQEAQLPAPSPPPAPSLPAALQGTDLASLQAQVAELRIQLAGLVAQRSGLRSQLGQMRQDNPARPGVQQKWADVGVQVAQTEGDIARLDARILSKQGVPAGTTSRPPGGFPRGFNPNLAIPAATLLLMVLIVPVSFAWARRVWRGKPKPAALSYEQQSRLERMEQALDTIAIEVERVSEGQRFVTKILAQAPARTAAPQSADVPFAEEKPPLALGAGPIEPIRVPERDGVRERIITPK